MSSSKTKPKASSGGQPSATASSSTGKSSATERKALKARYTHVHFCRIVWRNNDFKGKLEDELDNLQKFIERNFDTTIKDVVLESIKGYEPEEDLIKALRAVYAAAEDAAEAEATSGKHIVIILYSGHGIQGPIQESTFEAVTYKPHSAGPPDADPSDDEFAPQAYQQLILCDRLPEVTNQDEVDEEFVEPEFDYSTGPKAVLDWSYVWASIRRPAKMTSWVILQACQSGSATISKTGLQRKKLQRKIKKSQKSEDEAKNDADKESAAKDRKAAEEELDAVTNESNKRTKDRVTRIQGPGKSDVDDAKNSKAAKDQKKKGTAKKDSTAATEKKNTIQGPVHYWTAVGPDINARTGPSSFVKVFHQALEATCAKDKDQKRQTGATREFGDQGEFRVKDVWNQLSSVGADDADDKTTFEGMIGIDQEHRKRTREARRAKLEKEPGKIDEAKKIVVPNEVADWRLPFYSTVPVGWEDMRLLQNFEAARIKREKEIKEAKAAKK